NQSVYKWISTDEADLGDGEGVMLRSGRVIGTTPSPSPAATPQPSPSTSPGDPQLPSLPSFSPPSPLPSTPLKSHSPSASVVSNDRGSPGHAVGTDSKAGPSLPAPVTTGMKQTIDLTNGDGGIQNN